jgi:hypothetical protein
MAKPPSKPSDPFEEIAAALPTFDDDAEAQLTLLQQAMRDPPRGAPMDMGRDGEEEMVDPGAWAAQGHIDRRTRLPSNCPIVPLGQGQDGEKCYFLNTLGVIYALAPNAGKGHIDLLFAGRPLYLNWAWPRWSMPKNKHDSPRHQLGSGDRAPGSVRRLRLQRNLRIGRQGARPWRVAR